MQHLDEGTIHTWLDGALTPEEAARAEAHVKECAQCQAAVAEARGFIAASSRILTALDDAPRGVSPVAAPKRRVQPWIWRAAATVLVVATGTMLLVKQRGDERTMASKAEPTAPAPTTINAALPVAADSVAAGTAAASNMVSAAAGNRVTPPRATALSVKSAPIRAASKQAVVLDNAEVPPPTERRADADLRSTVPAPAPTAGAIGGHAFGAMRGALSAESTPREVGSVRTIGRTQTFYEIAPGDTVMLEEQSSVALENVVVTGAATARQLQPQAQRTNKTAAAAVESEQKAAPAAAPTSAPARATAVPSLQDAPTAERHSISWLDPSSRRVVILSGRHSQEELQKIREQIQRLRDAAQSKRNPD